LKNARAKKQARRLLDKQEYAGAVNFIREEVGKGAEEQALAEEYLQATNTSLEGANELMQRTDYPGAAGLYKTVLDAYPETPELQQRVLLNSTQIAGQLDTCAENLMEAGLVAYRAGEFTRGIEIWQQIIAFNPQHQPALDAIETTEEQLSRLKTMNDKE
jgi:tetratricopeptide (TPR) repeat protein